MNDYAKIILAIADSLRAAAAAEPLPPVPPLAEPLPLDVSEQVQKDAAATVADAVIADERENLLDRAVDRIVDNEKVRNAVIARAAEQVDHDAIAQAVADKLDESDILDRIDFDQMAHNLKDTIDEGAVIDAAAEQIAGQICFDKVVAAAAQKLAEQIIERLRLS
jgi:hypothetical protein